jgi:fructokinase
MLAEGARMLATTRIGVDLGGTKIEGVVLSATEPAVELARRRVPTPNTPETIIEAVVDLVRGLEQETASTASVGIGTPGAVSAATGLLDNSNTLCLNGRPLELELSRALGRPIVLENDANCLALSEACDGAGAGERTVFAVILGTGVGGGLVVDGRLVRGRNAIAGEWGHNPLPYPSAWERPGMPCYCGHRGCIETWLSGAGLTREYLLTTGHRMTAQEIGERAAVGEPAAKAAVEIYAERLSRALSLVINIVDPDVVVLGGGLSNLRPLYEEVRRLWGRWVFAGRRGTGKNTNTRLGTLLVPARWGDASGVRGAARLVGL